MSRKSKEPAKSNPLCLCVGAGITRHYIGSWNELLNHLARQMIIGQCEDEVEKQELKKQLSAECIKVLENDALLEQCEYLVGLIVKDTDISREDNYYRREIVMAEQVKAQIVELKGNLPAPDRSFAQNVYRLMREQETKNAGKAIDQWIVDDKIGTLIGVIKLSLKSNIAHIIDYNFDTILDECLANEDIQNFVGAERCKIHSWTYGTKPIKERVIENNGVLYHYGEMPFSFSPNSQEGKERIINIYHVHGICCKGLPTQPIIFSEHAYDEYQGKAWNWSNQILVSMMERFDILTVGFSGTDMNFRRQVSRVKEEHESVIFGSDPKRIILTISMQGYEERLNKSGLSDVQKDFLKKEYFIMMKKYYSEYYNIQVSLFDKFDDLSLQLEKWAGKPTDLEEWIIGQG